MIVGAYLALWSLAGAGEAHAQCARASANVSGRLYVSQAFQTGLDDSKGIKAANAEALEVCRGALGAPSVDFVRYANVAPSTFASPGDNTFCYLSGAQRVCVNARDAGNPPHINSIDCACVAYQCSDGQDNDGDGLVDLQDPGCPSPQGNNESSATSQCQDGADNDGDGAADFPADFSCSARTDNDEANPKSQCQDGIDNDGDGAVDFPIDFSCQGSQDNDELLPRAQCQDGVDNDGDGTTDFPADFSCQGSQDNDELLPKAQCQDGLDNDGDGAVDFPADFSCQSAQDNDELLPRAQCQDGVDNDGDGAIDFPSDFSCQSAQDNDELLPKAQCQDGVDNDLDTLVDSLDPGCSNGQDNDEGGDPARLGVSAECVFDNTDGTKAAVFSYLNATTESIAVAVGVSGTVTNAFSPGSADRGQPTVFNPGAVRGVVAVPLTGDSLTWTVRAPGSAAASATASAATPRCAAVEPQIVCQGYQNGELRAKGGYLNPNGFQVKFGYGTLNFISPGAANQGQPELFKAGLNPASFSVLLPSSSASLLWQLNGRQALASGALPVCDGECVDTPIGQVREELDVLAIQIAQLTTEAANVLASVDDGGTSSVRGTRGSLRTRKARAKGNSTDAERAKAKAQSYVEQSKALTIEFPDVVKNCPEAPQFCSTVDRGQTIDQLKALFVVARNQAQRTIARAYFRQTGSTSRKDALVRKAKELEAKGLANLEKLPRTETVCK